MIGFFCKIVAFTIYIYIYIYIVTHSNRGYLVSLTCSSATLYWLNIHWTLNSQKITIVSKKNLFSTITRQATSIDFNLTLFSLTLNRTLSHRGEIANLLDFDIVVGEFKFQSRYDVHFWTLTLNSSTTIVFFFCKDGFVTY